MCVRCAGVWELLLSPTAGQAALNLVNALHPCVSYRENKQHMHVHGRWWEWGQGRWGWGKKACIGRGNKKAPWGAV